MNIVNIIDMKTNMKTTVQVTPIRRLRLISLGISRVNALISRNAHWSTLDQHIPQLLVPVQIEIHPGFFIKKSL